MGIEGAAAELDRPESISITAGGSTVDEQASAEKQATIDTFLRLARQRFQTIVAATSTQRTNMREDQAFRAGDQWDAADRKSREADGRPCLTIPRLSQFIRQVTNQQRASNLAIRIAPFDDKADIETAGVIQGLIRHIEQQSEASVAYITAGDSQASIGIGYWQIAAEFEDERSFVQSLRIKRIRNAFSVYIDPAATEHDRSDMRFAFVVEDIPKDEFTLRFGDAAGDSVQAWEDSPTYDSDWMPEGKVRVANYWLIDEVEDELVLVRWPQTDITKPGKEEAVFRSEIAKNDAYKTLPELATRKVRRRQVKVSLISGSLILEGNTTLTDGQDWPGRWIPIVPILGDELDLDGKVDLRGMIRDAKDPQRVYNYEVSTLQEILGQLPRSPWVGAEGQFEGHETKWNQANRLAFSYLEYKPQTLEGQLAPPPQRTPLGADISPVMAAIAQSDKDMQATMGLYEPSLGVRTSKGQSGIAIENLQKQGENANSNFQDNLARGLRTTGRMLVDLLPKFYDAPRIVRILGDDDRPSQVMVHGGAMGQDVPGPSDLPVGVRGVYDISVGRYDVVVAQGPSIESKREQAFLALSQFIQVYPAAFPILGDLLVESLDWPQAQAAAKRLNKAMPPEFQEGDEGQPEIPAEAIQQIQVLTQQLQEMGISLDEAQKIIQTKQIETRAAASMKQAELLSNERIAEIRAQTVLLQEMGKIDADQAREKLRAEFKHLEQRLDHAHEVGLEALRGTAAPQVGPGAAVPERAPQPPAAPPTAPPPPGPAVADLAGVAGAGAPSVPPESVEGLPPQP